MLIIWKGAGVVVILIGILVCLALNIVTASLFNQNDYFQTHLWPKVAALWVIGSLCWPVGKYLNGRPRRVLIDKATGVEFVQKPDHTLMFIKVEYWAYIFFAIGVAVLAVGLVG